MPPAGTGSDSTSDHDSQTSTGSHSRTPSSSDSDPDPLASLSPPPGIHVQRPRPSQLFCQLSVSEKRSRNWRPLIASPLHTCITPISPSPSPSPLNARKDSPTRSRPGSGFLFHLESHQSQASSSSAVSSPVSPDSFFLAEIGLSGDEFEGLEGVDVNDEYRWATGYYHEVSLDEFPIVPPRPAPCPPTLEDKRGTSVGSGGISRPRTTPPVSSITPLPILRPTKV